MTSITAFTHGQGTMLRSVVAILSPSLGWARSKEVVAEQARMLRLMEPLTDDDVDTLLTSLSRSPGLVGVAARFARARAEAPRADGPWEPSAVVGGATARPEHPPLVPAPAALPAARARRLEQAPRAEQGPRPEQAPRATQAARPEQRKIPIKDIITQLAQHIGREKSDEVVRGSAARLSLPDDRLDARQATLLLETLSQQKGIIGVSARFAKVRLMLKYRR